jgi:hypothetical protein
LGELASELLARALAHDDHPEPTEPFSWIAKPMGPRVDLDDKEALRAVLGDEA